MAWSHLNAVTKRRRRRTVNLLFVTTAAASVMLATCLLTARTTTAFLPHQTAPATAPHLVHSNHFTIASLEDRTTAGKSRSSELHISCGNDFELHVGKALDTLKHDYPKILTDQPDFSIYDQSIEVVDPSGVKVHGINTYKNSFRVLHALVKFIYCPDLSQITFRMCFDKARQNIRIHWNAKVVPRQIFGGYRTTLHVDGISVYELDAQTGNITQHRIEKLIMNDRPVTPKEGVIHALNKEYGVTVPSFAKLLGENRVVPFQRPVLGIPGVGGESHVPSLFAMEASEGGEHNFNASPENFDFEAFNAKNKARKKFGLKPLSEEEFQAIQVEVQKLDAQQKQRAASVMAEMELSKQQQQQKSKPNFFDRMFGDLLKDTCESNFDCERPEVCCDFGFKKMCCSTGSFVGQSGEPRYAEIPVPVDIGYPPGQGPHDRYPPPRF